MRNINPVENTGIIVHRTSGQYLGSCFIFRYPGVTLTAAHVVKNQELSDLVVLFPGSRAPSTSFGVKNVIMHPSADFAIVEIDPPNERDITWAVHEIFDDRGLGLDLATYGYPQEWDAGKIIPIPRLLKGYAQRFFHYSSPLGYEYVAVEMSFGCPRGLSGSQIFNLQFPGRLYGIVSENIETSTERESTTEILDGVKEYKEVTHKVINYGIAVWLPAYTDWIDRRVPRVSNDEINRRGENQHRWNAEEAIQS